MRDESPPIQDDDAENARTKAELSPRAIPDAGRFVGRVIDSQYKVVELIWQRKESFVYKARYLMLDKDIAVKILPSNLVSDRNNLLAFKRGAQSASTLDHPNIVKIHGFGTTGGDDSRPYVAMEYVPGIALHELIKQKNGLAVPLALKIFIQVCAALSYAHGKGIVHGDLKDTNVLLASPEREDCPVKVSGFGIANSLQQEQAAADRISTQNTDDAFSSMSPEQCLGLAADKRTDVYLLGKLLYEALSGKALWQSADAAQSLKKRSEFLPDLLSIPGARSEVTDRLDALLYRALKKDPSRRYQSAADFAKELSCLQTDMESGQFKRSFLTEMGRQSRSLQRLCHRRRHIILSLLVAAILAISGLNVLWSNVSWFFEKHEFAMPILFCQIDNSIKQISKKSGADLERLQQKLEVGDIAYDALTASSEKNPLVLLRLWRKRVERACELGLFNAQGEALWQMTEIMNKFKLNNSLDYAMVSQEVANHLIASGNLPGSLPWLQKAVDIRARLHAPNAALYLKMGDVSFQLGRYGDARMQYYRADQSYLKENQNSAEALLGYAVCKASLGELARQEKNWASAEASYSAAMELLAKTDSAKSGIIAEKIALSRGYVNQMLGKHREAREFYAKGMPVLDGKLVVSPLNLQHILDDYAYTSWQANDYFQAVTLHNRAKSLKVDGTQKTYGKRLLN